MTGALLGVAIRSEDFILVEPGYRFGGICALWLTRDIWLRLRFTFGCLTVRGLRDFMANNGSAEASQGLESVCHDLTTEAARWMQYYHDAGD